MGYSIAVTGKGGVGKTTMSGLIIRELISLGNKPVLAIDADPNSCLDHTLGVTVTETVGRIREKAKDQNTMASGVSKTEFIEMKISESLVENESFDMLAMGRSEGAGCYCYANNVMKSAIERLSTSYPYIVLDNEAGLENLSRRLVQSVDLLVFIGDATVSGLKTLERLSALAEEMDVKYDKSLVIINRVKGDKARYELSGLKEKLGVDDVLLTPYDEEIMDFAESGRSLFELSADNTCAKQINQTLGEILCRK